MPEKDIFGRYSALLFFLVVFSRRSKCRISALFSSFQISFFLFDCKRWRFDRGGFDQIARSIELHVRLESKRPEREFITEFENVARQ